MGTVQWNGRGGFFANAFSSDRGIAVLTHVGTGAAVGAGVGAVVADGFKLGIFGVCWKCHMARNGYWRDCQMACPSGSLRRPTRPHLARLSEKARQPNAGGHLRKKGNEMAQQQTKTEDIAFWITLILCAGLGFLFGWYMADQAYSMSNCGRNPSAYSSGVCDQTYNMGIAVFGGIAALIGAGIGFVLGRIVKIIVRVSE